MNRKGKSLLDFKLIVRQILKVLAWLGGAMILIVFLVWIAVQLPATQNFLARKAVSFVAQKIDTRFDISGIDLDFPQSIVLKDIYLEDLNQDTLLYSGKLAINLGLFNLLSQKIIVEEIALADLAANIRRKNGDSTFNYQFIIDAFASKPVAPADTGAARWEIGLEQVEIAGARFAYDDRPAGQLLEMAIGRCIVDIDEFDIDSLNFLVENFELTGSALHYHMEPGNRPPPENATTADTGANLKFNILNSSIKNTTVNFADKAQDLALAAEFGHLLIKSDDVDLEARKIALENLQLDNSTLNFSHSQPPGDNGEANTGAPKTVAPDDVAQQGWSFSLNRLSLSESSFAYDNNYAGDTISHFTDFNHIGLTAGALETQDIEYHPGLVKATVSKALLTEARGINIGGLQAEVDISGKETRIDLNRLNLNGSSLVAHLAADFNALTASTNQMTGAPSTLEIDKATIALQDLVFFQPSLAESLTFLNHNDITVGLAGRFSGSLSDLTINQLEIALGDTTRLSAAGRLTDITTPDSAHFDIEINRLISGKADLARLIATDVWPASLSWPQGFELSAYVNGSLNDFRGNLETALYGGQFSSEFAGGGSGENAFTFSGEYSLKQFNLGTLLKDQKLYGPVTMSGSWQGSRSLSGEMSGTHTVTIDSLNVNNYTYNNLHANSKLASKKLQTTLQSQDEHLLVELENTIDFDDSTNTYALKLELEKADLQATNWVDDQIVLRGRMKSEVAFTSLDDLNGGLDIRKVEIIKNGELYKIDSLLLVSVNQTGKSEINIESDVLYADFKGNINFTSLPDAITGFINTYYPVNRVTESKEAGLQTFDFEVDIRNSDMLTEVLFPSLSRFEPAVIRGRFNNQQQELDITLDIPTMTYRGVRIDSLFFGLGTDQDKLAYQFNIDNVRGKNMEVNNFSIDGNFTRDSIDAHLAVLDSTGNKRWFVEASVVREEQDHVIKIFPENFMLNYEKWQVSPDNQIKLGKGRVYDSKLLISKGGQEIKIASDYNENNNPYVTIGISQLNLADVSRIVDEENGAVSGLLNADFSLESRPSSINYKGELKIADLGILAGKLGNLSLLARHEGNQLHFLELNLQNEVNQMEASGFFDLSGEATALDVNVDMARLSLSSVEALTFGALEDMEGLISGDFDVNGTVERPEIDGALQFDEVRFRVDFLNSYFGIKNESLTLADNDLIFRKFEIFDDDGDKAEINGALLTHDYVDFIYDLTIDAKRFKILDTQRDSQQPYFGKLYVNSLIKVTGNTDKPVVDLDLKVLEGTDLTYVVPQSEVGNIRRKGLVEFIDQDVDSDPFYQELYESVAEDTLRATLTGIDLTASIAVDDKSSMTILVDPVSGDFLSLKGSADLNLGIIPNGEISLSGRYEVAQGRYELSFYKLVKRAFDLEEGSYLIWTGDPYNPRLNITAIYTTQTSTYELINDQVIGESSSQLKQRVPVQLYMNMQGLLLSPEISFRFDMPEEDRQALGGAPYARLLSLNNDESGLNKQVFALLTLKRFIADDPLNTSGNTVESQARNSVSSILTSELNKLTDDVEVVDISLNVASYEDYSSGSAEGRTALELGISREFLDDRVVVNVAGNFDLEGNQGNQSNVSDYIGDLLIEYKLTEDGRFRLTGFRRSEYESIINQEVVGTGVGVIFVRDYNAFRELFNAKE